LEIPELPPPAAPVIQGALAPVDQFAEMAEPFFPHNTDRFSKEPAILWASTSNLAALREARPVTRGIRPVPDSIEEFYLPHKVKRFPLGPTALPITILSQAALRETGPTADCIRPVADGIAESFIPHQVNRFGRVPKIQWTRNVNKAVLREAAAPMRGFLPVPDCPQVVVFQNRSRFTPLWDLTFALAGVPPAGVYAAHAYEPIGDLGGEADGDRVVMPASTPKLWSKLAQKASEIERTLGSLHAAPARALFRRLAHPESMHSSFDTDLRDRIFSPILPPVRTRLHPATVEATASRLRESRVFAPLGFRWQRHRTLRDRGAPWKVPAAIGLRPAPAPADWPGPLSVTTAWGDRPAWPN
jgi:hypothetical protein